MKANFKAALLPDEIAQLRASIIAAGFWHYERPNAKMDALHRILNLPDSVVVVITDAGEPDEDELTGATLQPPDVAQIPVTAAAVKRPRKPVDPDDEEGDEPVPAGRIAPEHSPLWRAIAGEYADNFVVLVNLALRRGLTLAPEYDGSTLYVLRRGPPSKAEVLRGALSVVADYLLADIRSQPLDEAGLMRARLAGYGLDLKDEGDGRYTVTRGGVGTLSGTLLELDAFIRRGVLAGVTPPDASAYRGRL